MGSEFRIIVLCCIYALGHAQEARDAASNITVRQYPFYPNYDVDRHPNWMYLPENCGMSKQSMFRIIGGVQADLGEFPWLARVRGSESGVSGFVCGGALISSWHVVTAAHCGEESHIVGVRLGEYDTRTVVDCNSVECAPMYQDIEALSYTQHPRWSMDTLQDDIAVIRLARQAMFNEFVQPLCLPGRNDFFKSYYPEGEVKLAGWGITNVEAKELPATLQEVSLSVTNMDVCSAYYYKNQVTLLNDRQLCIGSVDGRDTCEGDSGGPVIKQLNVNNQYRNYLLGIVSFGSPECGAAPAIYTNIRFYLGWILDNL